MAELVLGKYEFHLYPERVREPPPGLEELVELLREASVYQPMSATP